VKETIKQIFIDQINSNCNQFHNFFIMIMFALCKNN